MSIKESLGVKSEKITSEVICECRIWCPRCGDKSATWLIDNPTRKEIKNSFIRLYDSIAFPKHINHGTITIIDERTTNGIPRHY